MRCKEFLSWLAVAALLVVYGIVGEMDRRDALDHGGQRDWSMARWEAEVWRTK